MQIKNLAPLLYKEDKVTAWHTVECFDAFVNMGNFNGVRNAPVYLPQNDPDQAGIRVQGLKAANGKYQLEQMTFGLTDSHQRLVDVVNLPPMVSELYQIIKNSIDKNIFFLLIKSIKEAYLDFTYLLN